MSATTHWLATATAQAVLERGGNAFDAATAAGFVLHVVEPHLNGPGGDLTGVFATSSDPTPQVLMGQGPAPAAATIAHYRGEGLDRVPGAGGLAAAIPGSFDAWLLLLDEHGTWELADVLDFAIGYARDGHPLVGRVGTTIETVAQLFTEHWPTSAALWMPQGRAPREGEVVRNAAYARTLERLLAAGAEASDRSGRIAAARREWKEGFVAREAAAFLRTPHRHSSGTDHAAVITEADFAGFSASFEPAVTLEFRGTTVAKTGAWGQGPMLLQTLAILDGLPDEAMDPSTAEGAHHVIEALKLALADRDAHYGEDIADGVLDELLSAGYAAQRRALIGTEASHEFRPGRAGGREPFVPPLDTDPDEATAAGVGEPTVVLSGETRGDTCHVDVVDRWGNVVAITPSGGWLQSSPAIPELGFCLGSRLQMTWLTEGTPSSLRPGVRPRTTLTPTLLLRDGQPVAALGSPGGDQQDQWQLLYLLRTLVGGYSPQQAIDAPALHTTSMPGSFWPRTWTPGGAVVEDRLGEDVIAELERRGHRITRGGDWSLGRLSSVGRDPATGVLSAAANPRGAQGYAAGR
ncbi:gamma-glutamyltransferase family protein [Pseudonocardia sp. MH-G8]|uniref:gamma-glutamyltransferase family protein n=1 Tax=Pseudonocardia sp. MH-G8 TaxID=1854588 RepID=UPI0018E9EA33|nr:gamma-glutamyltransferase [Pseudonocardia sp. MH-G8]